jgi:hypothetical protein
VHEGEIVIGEEVEDHVHAGEEAILRAEGVPRPPLLVDGRRVVDKRSVARYTGIGL